MYSTGTIGAPPVDLDKIENGRGTLYSFQNGKATAQVTGLGISNGLAFSAALKKFYYIDSRKGTLDEYDLDITKGTICKLRMFQYFLHFPLNNNVCQAFFLRPIDFCQQLIF